MQTPADGERRALKRTVAAVAALNFGYFFVEFAVAVAIASVALFADSIDFLEDATVNMLVLVALGWSAGRGASSDYCWRSAFSCRPRRSLYGVGKDSRTCYS